MPIRPACLPVVLPAAAVLFASAVQAGEVGVVEEFNNGVGEWGGGANVVQEATDGIGGAGDGWLHVSQLAALGRLGVRNTSSVFTGDLTAAGATGVRFALRDVGPADQLEIRVGVGANRNNFWITTIAFVPGADWQVFEVAFDEANWTQTQGSGTFAEALSVSNRLLFRHDLEPITATPDSNMGDFGLDRVSLVPAPGTALLSMVGLLLVAHRRR